MRLFDYKVKNEGFEGEAKLERLTFSQNMRYVAECNFKQDEIDPANPNASFFKNVDAITKMVELSKKHIKEIKITHKASGKCYNNFEDMEYDREFYPVIIEIASAVMAGQQVGGN